MLIAIGFVLFLGLGVRSALRYIYARLREKDDDLNRSYCALIFLLLCLSSWFADIIGIHAFFGAFAFGAIVPRKGKFIAETAPKIELLIVEFFLPLYFTAVCAVLCYDVVVGFCLFV